MTLLIASIKESNTTPSSVMSFIQNHRISYLKMITHPISLNYTAPVPSIERHMPSLPGDSNFQMS